MPSSASKAYRPQLTKARPWDDIEGSFVLLLPTFEPMVQLIRHIKTIKPEGRLFGYKGMHKIIVSIYDPIEWNREALHIEYLSIEKKFLFIYHSEPRKSPTFERKYKPEIGIEKFDKFMSMIKW